MQNRDKNVRQGQEEKKIKICIAQYEDADAIYHLMEQVHGEMEHPEHFICDDLPFVKRHISRDGFCLIARDQTRSIIANLIVRFPGFEEDNLGRDIELEEGELEKVAHMESVVVHPSARGEGIFARLLREAEQICTDKGYHYLMGTVSPENPASYINLEKQGYELVLTKPKYNGLMRRIYCKKIY